MPDTQEVQAAEQQVARRERVWRSLVLAVAAGLVAGALILGGAATYSVVRSSDQRQEAERRARDLCISAQRNRRVIRQIIVRLRSRELERAESIQEQFQTALFYQGLLALAPIIPCDVR